MTLNVGDKAPDFTGEGPTGKVSLADFKGKNVLLKFHRFAGCPVCNLHMLQIAKRWDEVKATGMELVVLVHSPMQRVDKKILKKFEVPYHLVADPDKEVFKKYGLFDSFGGMFAPKVMADYAVSMSKGFFSMPFGVEGGIMGHPADFLVDGEGVIKYCHYGKHYADSIDVDGMVNLATNGAPA